MWVALFLTIESLKLVVLLLQRSIWVHLSQARHPVGPLCPLTLQDLSGPQYGFLLLTSRSGPSQISCLFTRRSSYPEGGLVWLSIQAKRQIQQINSGAT